MAKKISQLTQATEVKSDDVTVIVQDGETKKLPLNMMVTKQDIENKKIAGLAKLDEIEATYENDTYTPTITVKNKSSVKTGEGDEVDYSANVMDGHVKSAILKGSTKYRDIDTGEVLDAFEDGRNLELVSVRMPVLTTTGKNLFDGKLEFGELNTQDGTNENVLNYDTRHRSVNYIPVKPNTNYTYSCNIGDSGCNWMWYDKDKKYIGSHGYNINSSSPSNAKYLRYFSGMPQGTNLSTLKVQIEEGTQLTPYEPYKSNILSCLEPVELGSVGEVKDELNLLTQQLTQRTETRPYQEGDELNSEFVTDMTNTRYKLAQEVVKTVDLMPSGTHPSTTPYCWKNGHIQLSSSGLLPNLEYSVVTSRAGQINQNATMIVKNDKRIFDLEILLAGGLVNTTYQALTLQNQVETGLSKVSLNSETEPDYLLYHMIMKLIEEKAYKLDDLTEKVSVFYLYEKLSDEQFETIYSALYPFVEDEIVEEPVVEELPEVVEDEVIM